MKIKNKIRFMRIFLLAGVFAVGLVSCSDKWDEHYKDPGKSVADKSLWQNITENPDLNAFKQILEKTGYDKTLSRSQMFTVWAPTNEAISLLDIADSVLVKEFVDNHVAMYSTPASGDMDKPVSMLNGKVIRFHLSGDNHYYFGNISTTKSNILSTNGILHIIDGYVPFQDNIWEYLAKEEQAAAIREYLYSFNNITFNPYLSTPGGGYDNEGNAIYLDSVFTNTNVMFSHIGQINNEDSTYTMIVPSNRAWYAKYNEAKSYFKFYNKSSVFSDSLQDEYTRQNLVKDLAFSQIMQLSPNDSLISTNHTVFRNPANLLSGAIEIPLSNGHIFFTDSLRFSPSESWHLNRIVEAETTLERINEGSTIYTRNALNTAFENISEDEYIEAVPTGASTNPTITFEIPATLSATYNIYCVFVPEIILKPANQALPFKVAFQILYTDSKGDATQTSIIRPQENVTDEHSLTKMLVMEKFKFPVVGSTWDATLNSFVNTTKLKVISDVRGAAEQLKYSRNLLIDCIIFEPVDE